MGVGYRVSRREELTVSLAQWNVKPNNHDKKSHERITTKIFYKGIDTMENIRIASVKRFNTEREDKDCYTKTVTRTCWTFSNGVEVSIMRHVMAFNENDVYKSIVVTPTGGLYKSYVEVSDALTVAERVAKATFPNGWEVKVRL